MKLSWNTLFEKFCSQEMHVYLLSPVIFLLFNATIWNIVVDIFVDIILNSALDNLCHLESLQKNASSERVCMNILL